MLTKVNSWSQRPEGPTTRRSLTCSELGVEFMAILCIIVSDYQSILSDVRQNSLQGCKSLSNCCQSKNDNYSRRESIYRRQIKLFLQALQQLTPCPACLPRHSVYQQPHPLPPPQVPTQAPASHRHHHKAPTNLGLASRKQELL